MARNNLVKNENIIDVAVNEQPVEQVVETEKPVEKAPIITLSTNQVGGGKKGSLTNKKREEIIVTQAKSLGIALQKSQIAAIIKDSRAKAVSDRSAFIQFVGDILRQSIEALEEQSRQAIIEVANDYMEDLNASNERFVEDVNATFQQVQKNHDAACAEQESAFEDYKKQFKSAVLG